MSYTHRVGRVSTASARAADERDARWRGRGRLRRRTDVAPVRRRPRAALPRSRARLRRLCRRRRHDGRLHSAPSTLCCRIGSHDRRVTGRLTVSRTLRPCRRPAVILTRCLHFAADCTTGCTSGCINTTGWANYAAIRHTIYQTVLILKTPLLRILVPAKRRLSGPARMLMTLLG